MPASAIDELLRIAGEHLSVLIRQAYEIGQKDGEETAKQRVLSLFGTPVSQATIHNSASLAEAATVSRPLREAMSMMDISEEGVGPKEVAEFISRQPNIRLDIGQVRAGIKTLETRGDLVRVSRGKYRLNARLLENFERRNEGAPNSSNELFGAPKLNGAEPLSP